jgi:hypothetical protein
LNVSGALYPLESSVYADFPAEALTPERGNSPQRETLSLLGSVSTWGQSRARNLNVSGALYPLESSVYAGFPAKSL